LSATILFRASYLPVSFKKRKYQENKKQVAGGWGKLHNEELHNLYASPNGDEMK
jgi:hypothetical protein